MPLIRSVALNVIKSLVPLNLPGAEVIHYLQQMNLGYRRIDMLKDIRTAFDRVKYETQITKLKPDSMVPEAWMNTEKLGAPYNYRVHLKVEYYDEANDAYVTGHRFMFENDLKSVGEYEGDYPDYATAVSTPEEFSYVGSQVVGVTKNMRAEPVPF